jgi:2-amino-4-hydroxy-6-hydroxymethyldihydropteridine diphosphokinase
MGSERVFITIGSNIEPEKHLPWAAHVLAGDVHVVKVSRVYATDPVGPPGQPRFLNAALLVTTDTPPAIFKHGILRPIEALLGRVRSDDKFAPRTIDLDIALYGSLVKEDPENALHIPDPDILRYPHVALPLADLDPEFRHPVTGETLAQIAAGFAGAPGVKVIAFEIPQ